MRRYDFIFSIGQACSCTENLRKARLQVFSYPFDWLYGTDLENRVKLLTSGFKNWFNEVDFSFVEDKPGARFHVYKNRKTGLIFNHDFPREEDFKTGYGTVSEKYGRRVARLLNKIETSRKVLAVYIEQPYTEDFIPDAKLIELQRQLAEKFGAGAIDLLYVHKGRSRQAEWRDVTDGVMILALDYRSTDPNAFDYQVNRKCLSGALKKKIGLTLCSRVYWIWHQLMKG